MQHARIFEVYGQAKNGARHNLGNYFAQSERGAKMQAKRDFPEYSDLSATLDQKLYKSDFYAQEWHHTTHWSTVVYKG